MASVQKRKNSPFYCAAYRGEDGQRKRKSTKQTNKSEALAIAISWERLAAKGRHRTITETQARKVVNEILENSIGETLNFFTVKAWIEEWLASKKGTVQIESHGRFKQVLRGLLKHLGERAEFALAAVSPKDIRGYRDELLKGRSIATVNQVVQKFLSPPFSAALRLGYIPANPCAAVIPLLDEVDAVRDVFTSEQVAALLGAADDDWRGIILAGYFTGLRLRDITNLVWQSVDLESGILTVKTRKTGASVLVPIHPQLAEWFRSRPPAIGKAPVFPALCEMGTGGKTGLSGRFASLMERAGVKGRMLRGADGNGRKTMSLSFHSLRHSFVSALANAGVSPEIRKKLSGHTDDKSHAGYTHHDMQALRGAMDRLQKIGGVCE